MAAELRFLVRTVPFAPERLENVKKMKLVIPQLEVLVDESGSAYESYRVACEMINDTGAVLLEDDGILCRDFLARITAVIQEVGPEHVAQFFERPKTWFPRGFSGGSNFASTLCTYLPAGFAGRVYDYYDEFHERRPTLASGMATDNLIAYALIQEKRRYWRERPCLIQHETFASTLGPRAQNRQTIYFADDLEKQGVDYNDLKPAK